MAEGVTTVRKRAIGAQGLAYLAIILAIVALIMGFNAQHKATQASNDASHAISVSRDAQSTANKAVNAGTTSTGNSNAPASNTNGSNVVLPTGGGE